jgi:hypothetical protein
MTSCDYQILEYTTSELQVHGVPFIVILRLYMQNSFTLTGYILRNWKAKIGALPREELNDIAVFWEDLRFHFREEHLSNVGFFDRLQKLDVGPVRTFVSGSCLCNELDTIIPTYFTGLIPSLNWRESFESVGEDFLGQEQNSPLQTYQANRYSWQTK